MIVIAVEEVLIGICRRADSVRHRSYFLRQRATIIGSVLSWEQDRRLSLLSLANIRHAPVTVVLMGGDEASEGDRRAATKL